MLFHGGSPEENTDYEHIKKLCDFGMEKDILVLICDSASVGGFEGQESKVFSNEERNAILDKLLKHPYGRHHNLFNFRFFEGCPAGIEKIYITAYGETMPCDLIHESYGSIREESIKSIWGKMRKDPRFAQKTKFCVRYLPDGLEKNL